MSIASDLLQQHIQTLVDDNARWQTLIADNILWELAYAPSLGHPVQLSGREEAVRHATWCVGAVENFRFFHLKVLCLSRSAAQRHFRPSDGIRLSCIAATSSLEPDPQRVITLIACVNGTSTGCTRAAVRI